MLKRIILAASLALAACTVVAAPAFQLTDTRGTVHTLEQYHGKWVLVNLWASWCAPCLDEMPELEALHRARNDLVILGLAVDGQSAQRVTRFAEKLQVTYPIVAGNDDTARSFKLRGYPTSMLFDRDGRQVYVKEGRITREEIEARLGGGAAAR